MDAVTALFALAFVLTICLVAYVAFEMSKSDRVEDRIARYVTVRSAHKAKDPQKAEETRQRQIQNKVKNLSRKQKRGRSRAQLTSLVRQAGLNMNTKLFAIGTFGLGGICALAALAFGVPSPFAIPAFLAGAFILPKQILKLIATRRQKEFTKNFPDALDVLTRGLKSGLPVNECMEIVAKDGQPPVSEIFDMLVKEARSGMSLDEALGRAVTRMPTPEMRFFATVVNIQQQTGGNLASIIDNISSVIRGRATLKEKIKSMSMEAKSQAAVIGTMPFLVVGALKFINPEYLDPLFDTMLGNVILIGGITWMLIGVFTMWKMSNIKV